MNEAERAEFHATISEWAKRIGADSGEYVAFREGYEAGRAARDEEGLRIVNKLEKDFDRLLKEVRQREAEPPVTGPEVHVYITDKWRAGWSMQAIVEGWARQREAEWQAEREARPFPEVRPIYKYSGGLGVCTSHTGGPHRIEATCVNWQPLPEAKS